MLKIRRVPWRNKAEWMVVYNNAFSNEDLSIKEAAVQTMDSWIRRGHCPPAVEYTCRFLQSVIHDRYFFPSLTDAETEENLQLQYATSMLRFINILGEIESIKSLSLNARALQIGLPEWVVNTRHQISHGSNLPSLDILRVSVESLLEWLKENYWEVEKEAMDDLVLVDRASILKEKFTTLLTVYVFLNGELAKNTQLVQNIQDDCMKQKILALNSVQFQSYVTETCQWEANTAKLVDSILSDPRKMLKLPIANTISSVVRAINPYFACDASDQVVSLFVDFILQDNANTELCTERWQLLLVALHTRSRFPAILNRLLDITCQKSSVSNRAAEWVIILLKSLLKRSKAEKKLSQMSKTSIPSSKRLKLSLTEKEKNLLKKNQIKLQLSSETVSEESKFDVLHKLYEVIERKNPQLKSAPRLKVTKFLTEREIYHMVNKIFLSPNDHTKSISELLLSMSSRLTPTAVENLLHLMKIKESMMGDGTVKKNIASVYDSSILARSLSSETQISSLVKRNDECSGSA